MTTAVTIPLYLTFDTPGFLNNPAPPLVLVPGSGPDMAQMYLDTIEESSLIGITYTS
jgi:hypothetical protein